MVNMLVSIFLLNGAGRCPPQPVHKSPILISRPFKELGLFCCLFLFLCLLFFFLFSATISNLTLRSRIVSITVDPKPNGTLNENVTVVFSCNIVSFSFINNFDFNSFQTSRSTPPPTKRLNIFRTVYAITPNLATFPEIYLSWEHYKIIVVCTCAPPLKLPWKPSLDSYLFQNFHFFSFRFSPFLYSFFFFHLALFN